MEKFMLFSKKLFERNVKNISSIKIAFSLTKVS